MLAVVDDSTEMAVSYATVETDTTVVTTNNQITLTKTFRDIMGVEVGDKVKFVYDGESITIVPMKENSEE